jgi:hypothetical protein
VSCLLSPVVFWILTPPHCFLSCLPDMQIPLKMSSQFQRSSPLPPQAIPVVPFFPSLSHWSCGAQRSITSRALGTAQVLYPVIACPASVLLLFHLPQSPGDFQDLSYSRTGGISLLVTVLSLESSIMIYTWWWLLIYE